MYSTYIYTYLNRYGYEQVERFRSLKEALVVVARHHEQNQNIPLSLRGGREVYQQQELLLLCHKYKLL